VVFGNKSHTPKVIPISHNPRSKPISNCVWFPQPKFECFKRDCYTCSGKTVISKLLVVLLTKAYWVYYQCYCYNHTITCSQLGERKQQPETGIRNPSSEKHPTTEWMEKTPQRFLSCSETRRSSNSNRLQ